MGYNSLCAFRNVTIYGEESDILKLFKDKFDYTFLYKYLGNIDISKDIINIIDFFIGTDYKFSTQNYKKIEIQNGCNKAIVEYSEVIIPYSNKTIKFDYKFLDKWFTDNERPKLTINNDYGDIYFGIKGLIGYTDIKTLIKEYNIINRLHINIDKPCDYIKIEYGKIRNGEALLDIDSENKCVNIYLRKYSSPAPIHQLRYPLNFGYDYYTHNLIINDEIVNTKDKEWDFFIYFNSEKYYIPKKI